MRRSASDRLTSLGLTPHPEGGHFRETYRSTEGVAGWFGATPLPGISYSLVGCTVAPGFEFADLELGNRHQLIRSHPQHAALIERLAR
jgi:uncharacterized protein